MLDTVGDSGQGIGSEPSGAPGQVGPVVARRTVLAGAGVVVGAALLAGCGDDDRSPAAAPSASATTPAATSGTPATSSSGAAGQPLAKLADVPVGGALAVKGADGKPVIVAQPSKGEVVAFSAICTHQGCTVAPRGDVLACPCHGSRYALDTGAVVNGPAPRPLAKIAVTVRNGEVVSA
jgi:Rieske Fe-S protein